MNGLSLCSGIGGLDLGVRLAVPQYRTVCYVEKEPFCQDILCARMADGLLDRGALWDDLTTFSGEPWRGLVDIVHGGYPCQPFSVAGKRRGAADARHLWPDIARIVSECEPEYCFFENVAGHLTLGFDVVARELEAMGYRVAAGLFTAAEVGAPHRRQRLYILAHSAERAHQRGIARPTEWGLSTPNGRGDEVDVAHRDGQYDDRSRHTGSGRRTEYPDGGSTMGHVDDPRLEGRREPEREGPDEWPAWPPGPEERDRWTGVLAYRPDLAPAIAAQSPVRGVAHGLPRRVDRLKALGNAVVPDVAALAWRTLHAQLSQ